ncbi:sulfite exporter TauE/SafE family protein [Halorhabdus amylolytica]|uniref:sulfite exporter TauE/SafE family protein n=1 Tax=Halorhabdus amylolytica TaxID=2559573 RepID=UPI0010AABA03|nr:sulfite exporter TauE/SafE family protein [Halorhabdus amylolytica]
MAGSLTDPTLAVLFAVGFFGGAHCLGMCGPLVTLYGERMTGRTDRGPSFHELRQHGLFNLGRAGSYAIIGALLGAVGSVAATAAGFGPLATQVRAGAGVLVGAAIVLVGLGYVRSGTSPTGGSLPIVGSAFERVTGALTTRVDRLADGPGIAALGAVHGLLPCPLLYPAYLYALSTGSALSGALALGALGLGTIPALFAYGTAFQSLPVGTRRHLHRALGVAFVVLGTIPLARGLTLFGVAVPHLPLPMPPTLS